MSEQNALKAFIFFREWRDKILKYCKDDAQIAEFMRVLWDAAFDGKEYTGDNEIFSLLLDEMMRAIKRQHANFEKRGRFYNYNNYNNNYNYNYKDKDNDKDNDNDNDKIRQQKNSFSSKVSDEEIEKFKRRINNGE